jgi:hypothetical protein
MDLKYGNRKFLFPAGAALCARVFSFPTWLPQTLCLTFHRLRLTLKLDTQHPDSINFSQRFAFHGARCGLTQLC